YWTGDDPIKSPTRGVWETFQQGSVSTGKGRTETVRLVAVPVAVRFVRIWMIVSSNSCDADGPADPRNCVGYSIRELYLGTTTEDGGVNKDIEVWPDASGRVPWTARFIDYLKQHGLMKDLAFVSFEYPYD